MSQQFVNLNRFGKYIKCKVHTLDFNSNDINMLDKHKNFNSITIIILVYGLIHNICLNMNKYNVFINNLSKLNNKKFCFIQDEYYHINLLNVFLNKINIDLVFTVITNNNDIGKIYNKINKKVKFVKVLTGYIDEITTKYFKPIKTKKQDILYRWEKITSIVWIIGLL